MPCNMMSDATSGDFAQSTADTALRKIASIEQALCGVYKTLEANGMVLDVALRQWWVDHQRHPGHVR